MAIRPGRCYSKFQRPYTRISIHVPSKSYVVGVPAAKITQFEMGAKKKNFEKVFRMVSAHPVQIRDNALEAARQGANKHLEKTLTLENYFLKVLVYPYQVLRENSLATGAGADRFQEGMRKSFGKPIGTAARVFKNQAIMELRVAKGNEKEAKRALEIASKKVSGQCRTIEVR
ncbi:MAG: 50S ribosomal protein L16 [Candidatus Aenigmarchaeota archaeon]|nr:50S ribosomal protein L16 [Candidatus Aenigmarchaeota archaeon]